MEQHNKCEDQSRRLGIYLAENIPYSNSLVNYTYATQLVHAEAMTEAYRQWRRMWRADGKREVGGIITWQLNDCWPTASWAIADYYLRPKQAYFAVKRESAAFTLGIERIIGKAEAARPFSNLTTSTLTLRVWATNSSLNSVQAKLTLKAFDTIEQKLYDLSLEDPDKIFEVAANGSTDLIDVLLGSFKKFGPQPKVVVWADLLDAQSGTRLARLVDWSQPLKLNYFIDPKLDIQVKGDKVTVTATRAPVKGVWLDLPESELKLPKWSDNGFDLFIGESLTVSAKGLEGRSVTARWLGDHINESYL
jgi:beta-mannosidase